MDITEVGIGPDGHFFVRTPASEDFTFIWRAARWVRWNSDRHTLVAYPPERWQSVELFKQIVAAVEMEYGCTLELTSSTVWSNVPDDLRAKLDAAAK